MTASTSAATALAQDILNRLEALIVEAHEAVKPLELDPYRGQLFELFVMADAAGLLDEASEHDLTADGVCRTLAARWGLADATREALQQQARLGPAELARMRLLWSVMRMWMEWTYAWQRWPEFHEQGESG